MKPLDPFDIPLAGTQLVEASAGTGKTYTITTLFLRLLLEAQFDVDEILVVTFTNAATAELKDRIRGRLVGARAAFESGTSPDDELRRLARTVGRERALERLESSLSDFDEAPVFTIHGFCQRVLKHHAFESGVRFDAELAGDDSTRLAELVEDFWTTRVGTIELAILEHLVTRKRQKKSPIGLGELHALARTAVEHSDAVPLPGEVELCLDGVRLLDQELAGWASAWRDQGDEVRRLLLEHEGLNRNSYREETLLCCFAEMDELADRAATGTVDLIEGFDRFTTTALRKGTKKNHEPPEHRFFEVCDLVAQAHEPVRQALSLLPLKLRLELVDAARREHPRRKAAQGVMSYTDLLLVLRDALHGPAGTELAGAIRLRYPAALVDEFQDTDPVQYDIFRTVYGRPPATLFLIGDPKQAIYGFRSADVFAYRRARLDAGASIHTLATNHRSGPGLVAAVSALFENRERAFYLDWIEFPHTTAHRANDRLALAGRPLEPFELLFVERDGRALDPVGPIPRSAAQEVLVPALVADDLVRFLDSGATLDSRRVEPGDIAVLVRTNRQADKVQGQLRLRGVPSVLYGDASVLDTAEAAEIEQVLGAVAEPARAPAVRVALSTSIFGLDGSSIARLRDDETGWEEWTGKLERWRRTWFDRGFIQLFRMILEELEVEPRLLECVDGERRMTNLRHLGELLHTTSGRLHLGPTGLVNWLKTVRNDRAAREHGEMEDAQIRLESDEKAVRLVTIHGSKGLQYPVVYCPFLWVGHPSGSDAGGCLLFHGGADREVLTLDLGSESRDRSERLALEEALSENLRLTYVALTRAESRLVLVWGCFAGGIDSPLGYLLDPRRRAGQPPFETPAGGRARKGSDEPTDDRMIAAVEEAFAGAEAHLRIVRRSPPEELRTYVPERHDEVEPVSREVREAARRRYRVSSFTDLSTAHEAPTAQRESGLDRDAAGTSAAGPPVAELAGEPEAALAGRVPLADFPKGKNAGSFLHGVLEELEFDSADPERIGELVARFAPRFGLAGRVDSSGISRAFASVLATPLTGDGLTLRSVTSESRLTELEFTLPAGRDRPVTGAAIAEVFARHGSARVPASYPGCLERLDFPALRGYLKGFIDLAFVHHDRWFVVDYKSNHLGDRWVDYGEALLDRAMEVHHYYLQYHLYVAALHRYLKLRWPPDRPPYDYEAHFGGVLYLFLRGMSPETGACGVFSDRPSLAMVEALLAVLDRAEPGGAA